MDDGSINLLLQNAGVGEVKRQRPYRIFQQAFDRTTQSTIHWEGFKLVNTWESGQIGLFNPSRDLSEANNPAATLPQKTAELEQKLTAFLSQGNATIVKTNKGNPDCHLRLVRSDRDLGQWTAEVEILEVGVELSEVVAHFGTVCREEGVVPVADGLVTFEAIFRVAKIASGGVHFVPASTDDHKRPLLAG
jgi:hypothetical protein